MFAGTKIKIGDKEYVMPYISLGQLRNGTLAKLNEHDQLMEQGKFFELTLIRGEVLLETLRRNYPDFSREVFDDYFSMGNITPIWMTVLGGSGFVTGEETAAVTTSSNGTSSPSTED